jgi:hypothetical protein
MDDNYAKVKPILFVLINISLKGRKITELGFKSTESARHGGTHH